MKTTYILIISAFFKTVLYSVLIGFVIFFMACFILSCSASRQLTGEKICKVVEKKYERGHYYSYTCLTLFSKEKVYLTGFEKDANINDTIPVVIRKDGFNYFKKGM